MLLLFFFNKLETAENREVEDLNGREIAILSPLCALMIIIGCNPTPILERMEPSVRIVLERIEEAGEKSSVLNVIEIASPAQAEAVTQPEGINQGSPSGLADGEG